MSQGIEKLCRVCGTNVAGKKRTKDAAGRYYCEPCHLAVSNSELSGRAPSHFASTTTTTYSRGKVPFCKSCGGKIEVSADKRRTRCMNCGKVCVIEAKPESPPHDVSEAEQVLYIDTSEKIGESSAGASDQSSSERFSCPLCQESVAFAEMHPRGICRECAGSHIPENGNAALACTACHDPLAASALFCSNCGLPTPTGVPLERIVAIDEIVVQMRTYADGCAALKMVPALRAAIESDLAEASQNGDKKSKDLLSVQRNELLSSERAARANAERSYSRLRSFDYDMVISVRDQVLNSPVVDQNSKDGLRADILGLFNAISQGGEIPPRVERRSPPLKTKVAPGAATTKTKVSNSQVRSKPPAAMAKQKEAGGAAMLFLIIAIPFLLLGMRWTFNPLLQLLFEGKTSADSNLGRGLLFFAIGLVVYGCAGGAQALASKKASSNGGGGIKVVVVLCFILCLATIPFSLFISPILAAVVAVPALILAVYLSNFWSAACPSCGRWNAARRVNSTLLDRHQRSEDVEREDKHWTPQGELIGKTVRQESVIKTVERHRNTYQCRYCKHSWERVQQSET